MQASEREPFRTLFEQIAEDIRCRILGGELKAGDRIPSIRQISHEWSVAHATATKVVGLLKAEGLVVSLPGACTMVAGGEQITAGRVYSRSRIVDAAIGIADDEGLAATTMRRVAAKLEHSTMSLYHHLKNRPQLLRLMADSVLGEAVPRDETPYEARVEAAVRALWNVHRRHPWLSQLDLDRLPGAAAHEEWTMRALVEQGVNQGSAARQQILLRSFVRGLAADLRVDSGPKAGGFEGFVVAWPGGSGTHGGLVPVHRVGADELFELGLRGLLSGLGHKVTEVPAF
ncbi:GntR family transcriptional regulator [Amycolatopsis thailandensis]|uniref:GntR family transcriptional regulator n=1 Tax=Amycolatopsis thailandensis TaxID=589330 RepID=UPI00363953E4